MAGSKGFTLIELMIVIAIIGVLASVAVPQYASYTLRAKFSDVVSETVARKTAVSICYQETDTFFKCNGVREAGDYGGIPADIFAPGRGVIGSIRTVAGVITSQGTEEVGDLNYVLTPQALDGHVVWTASGTCITVNACRHL